MPFPLTVLFEDHTQEKIQRGERVSNLHESLIALFAGIQEAEKGGKRVLQIGNEKHTLTRERVIGLLRRADPLVREEYSSLLTT